MNFDEFRNNYRNIKCDNNQVVPDDFKQRVEGVVDKIKKENRRDKVLILSATALVFIAGILNLLQGISVYIQSPETNLWWGYFVYVFAMFSGIPALLYKYYKIHRTKYDIPVLDFIKQIEKTYAFFQKSMLFLLPFIVLSGVAVIFLIYPDRQPTVQEMLVGMIPIAAGVVIGFAVGALMWVNKKLPILDEIRQIKESLER